jgi:hypothetical protein
MEAGAEADQVEQPQQEEQGKGKPGKGKKGKRGGDTASSAEALKYLLGGAGVLQVILTALGVSNGGVAALAVNDFKWVAIGFGCVLASIAFGAVGLALNVSKRRGGIVWVSLGTALLFGGIATTAYAALIEPGVAKAPNINVALAETASQLDLTAHVTASGIPDSSQYWFEIDAREYRAGGGGGRYVPLGTPLYQNQLGADGQGNINSIVTIPLPPGKYNVVSVEAWNGAHAGPCGSLQVEGGASLTQTPTQSKAKKTKKTKKAKVPRRRASDRRARAGHAQAATPSAVGVQVVLPKEPITEKKAMKVTAARLEAHGRAGCVVLRLPR